MKPHTAKPHANSSARKKSNGPRYHPATGQILSRVAGESPYIARPASRRSGKTKNRMKGKTG